MQIFQALHAISTHAARHTVRALTTGAALVALLAPMMLATPAQAAGVLVPRDGRAPVRVRSQRVSARLEDGLARTTVRQTFVSPHRGALEAIYVFPVPEGAALVDVAMEVGGQRLEGLVVERKKARRVYNEIVRGRRDPALVEQIGRGTFRLSVFPVLPDVETVVELTWIEHANLADGRYRYTYPLALSGDTTQTEQDLTFTLEIASTAALLAVTSPTEGMDIVIRSKNAAVASFEQHRARLDRDLVVEARVGAPQASLGVRTFRDTNGALYLAAVVTPPTAASKDAIPRDVTLLLDVSGSMAGVKIIQARAAALYLVENARDIDRVNVIRFNAAVDAFAAAPAAMTAENRAALAAFVRDTDSGGSTALGDALDVALAEPVAPGRVRTIVLLSDGRATVGLTDTTQIVKRARASAQKGARVYAFGVGSDLDEGLLRGVSAATRGRAEVFRQGEEIEGRLSAFLRRTAAPVLADLALTADGARLAEVYPRPVPDVFLGEQSVLTTRIRGDVPTSLTVTAMVGGKQLVLTAAVPKRAAPGGSAAVRQIFAQQKIAFLEEALRLRKGLDDDAYYAALDKGAYDSADEIVQEIVTTSIECGVQSAYASFLVLLPEDRARLNPRDLASLQEARKRAAAARREAADVPAARDTRTADAPETEEDAPIEEMEKDVEDPVVKDGKVADHNETNSDFDDGVSLGDPRFNSDAPFEGPGSNGTIGIGGGAGGAFGGRRGGRRNLRAGGGGKKTQSAVDLSLEWLKIHQTNNGHWDADGFDTECKINKCGGPGVSTFDPGLTGLTLLSFLGAGETHNSGQYKDVVKNGLRYLKSIQDAEGCFGPRASPRFLHDHMWAALAMTEAYGLTGSRLFKDSAQRGVDFVLAAQNPYLGWGSGIRTGESNTSMTVLATMVLKSAKMADLNVDNAAFKGALAWLDQVTDPMTGRVGERARGDGDVDTARAFPSLSGDALIGGAIIARIFCGEDPQKSDAIAKGTALLLQRKPRWDESDGSIDFAHWYFGTLALFQVGGESWSTWNKSLKTAVADSQRVKSGRDERGSWDPVDARAKAGGRVYATAINQLSLEIYYRYGRVFGARRRR